MLARLMSEQDGLDPSSPSLRLQFEELLANLSSHFINVDAVTLDSVINDALEQLSRFFDVDRAGLSQIADDRQSMIFTHYWTREGNDSQLHKLDAARLMPHGFSILLLGDVFSFSSLTEFPPDVPDRSYHASRGTKSAIALPIAVAGRVVGVLGFSAAREERRWDPNLVRRLRVIADVIGSALTRQRAIEEHRRAVDDRLEFEAVITEVASRFIGLPSSDVDGVIEESQRQLCETLHLDRSSLVEFTLEGHPRLTHYWQRGVFAPMGIPRGAIVEGFPWTAAAVAAGRDVRISSLMDVPADTPDRALYQQVGTKATLVLSIAIAGRVVGALTFASMTAERAWPDEIVTRLRLAARIFATAIARKRSEEALRQSLDENARLRERLVQENLYLQREVRSQQGGPAIAGSSQAIRRMLEDVEQVARTDATVLLLGETGTGKELVASAIHDRSARNTRAMVRVNCAAIPVALVESELFGREKGAYTGALSRQIGRFEVADGSTIFLDEIGELPTEVQVKLLRVLQERQIERLGSPRPIDVDVRVVAATNRNLEQMAADGTFRQDLFYRLNVFPIHVPPLRERADDIPTLVWAFVEECSRTLGKRIESIAKSDMQALQRYHWPGNVRELRNTVERAMIVATGARLVVQPPVPTRATGRTSLRLQDVERDHVRGVLERTGWRVRGEGGAAELLGLKPSTLEDRMDKLGLKRPSA